MREATTKELMPSEIRPSWGYVIAVMDYLSPLGKEALRIGVQSMLKDCMNQSSTPENIQKIRELVEILAHLPTLL